MFVEIPITIAHREFRSETLHLTPSLTSLVADPNPERTAESERLWAILARTGNQIYHTGRFVLPVTSTRRTSQFGTRRVNAYSDGRRVTSIHAGVDFGIPTGTEVRASGRGRVVLSRMRILTGYSVILEHAPGVYSLYYHLDSVIAQEGTIVNTGAIIGLSGSTGFSTGPHLHWEVRVSTENTDPDILVSRPLLDKDLIISRLFN
jgi:murein DD-endopeptidase MepM/ murein hydrolase activator NlpD